MAEHRYLSLRQVQTELGLWPGEVDDLLRTGRLPAFRIAGHWRVDRLMLERLVEDLTSESEPLLHERGRERPAVSVAATGHPPPVEPWTAAPRPRDGATLRKQGLTEQQLRIVQLVSEGMSNAEIARLLSIEVSTVKSHVSKALQRFNLRDREQLIAHVWRSGAMEA